jgi:hypothetical protein
MNIKQHKALVAAIPEDLKEGEEIEVSDDGIEWSIAQFSGYSCHYFVNATTRGDAMYETWYYARRPAPVIKRLKDEPWEFGSFDPLNRMMYRAVDSDGSAWAYHNKPSLFARRWKTDGSFMPLGHGYDPTDWQHSLEERPTSHQKHMADIDKGIKAAEAGIKRNLEQRRTPDQVYGDNDSWTGPDDHSADASKKVEALAPYGYCPMCGLPGVDRERRPDGLDHCKAGHIYASRLAQTEPHADSSKKFEQPWEEVAGVMSSTTTLGVAQLASEKDHIAAIVERTRMAQGTLPEEKKYRPWRLGDKIPAPLMVRRKSWGREDWRYAYPYLEGFAIIMRDRVDTVEPTKLFLDYVQADGRPAGQEE